jgi:hypothetical protein
MKTLRIDEFRENERSFSSTGISKVKMTQDGEVVCLEIPIQSTGISELIETFQANAPRPPAINILVKPDDPIGKEMKLSKSQWMKIPDLTDAAYLKAKDEHNNNLGMAILSRGLAVDIKDASGNVVKDVDAKVAILKKTKMSSDQFAQIIGDITSLTQWSDEERNRFFGPQWALEESQTSSE